MKLLILQELESQPDSYLEKITSSFEMTSVTVITQKEEVRSYKTPPAFSDVFVMIFKSLDLFKSNQGYIKHDWMWPILLCRTASALASAKAYCLSKDIAFQVSIHAFEKSDAERMVRSLAREDVSKAFVDAVISQVGLSPNRILSAIGICDVVGYTASAVKKYVDKYRYTSIHDVVLTLLGLARKRQTSRGMLQLEQSLNWFKWFKKQLIAELELIESVFVDALAGEVSNDNLLIYIENKGIARYEIMFCLDLFSRISLVEIKVLKERVKLARNVLELISLLQ